MSDITIHIEETEYIGLCRLSAVDGRGNKYTTGPMPFEEIGHAVDHWLTDCLCNYAWAERNRIWHPVAK